MQIQIKLPFKTPTVNHLYGQRPGGSGRARFIKKEAKDLRKKITEIVRQSYPIVIPNLNRGLKVRVEINEDWFTKKGTVKRKDVANREKFLIDSVFGALEIDDKFIFEHNIVKIQNKDEEFAIVKIETL